MGTRAAADPQVRAPDNLDRLLALLDQAQVERLWAACRTDSAAPIAHSWTSPEPQTDTLHAARWRTAQPWLRRQAAAPPQAELNRRALPHPTVPPL